MRQVRHILTLACLAVSTQMLVGCPVPLPSGGYEETSRANIPAARPDWIVEGTTTRADVILRLGSPDEEARDSSWIGYLSSRHEGGVVFVVPVLGGFGTPLAVESYNERRLVLWLDKRNTVSKVLFEVTPCSRQSVERIKSGPCTGFADIEKVADAPSIQQPKVATDVIATFADTIWQVPFFDFLTDSRPPDFAAYRGPVLLLKDKLRASGKAIGGDARGELEIEFRYVTHLWRHTLGRSVTLVITANGVQHGFTVVQQSIVGGVMDKEKTEKFIKTVEKLTDRTALSR